MVGWVGQWMDGGWWPRWMKQKEDVDGRKDLLEVDECLCHK